MYWRPDSERPLQIDAQGGCSCICHDTALYKVVVIGVDGDHGITSWRYKLHFRSNRAGRALFDGRWVAFGILVVWQGK